MTAEQTATQAPSVIDEIIDRFAQMWQSRTPPLIEEFYREVVTKVDDREEELLENTGMLSIFRGLAQNDRYHRAKSRRLCGPLFYAALCLSIG